MSYFNTNGSSAGPIQVNTTWIGGSYTLWLDHKNERHNDYYTAFSFDRVGEKLLPLKAGSPSLSWKTLTPSDKEYNTERATKTSDGNQYLLLTPLDSVVTVRFLSAYTAIAPGDLTFDPDDFITRAEFVALELKVNKNIEDIASHDGAIKELDRRTNALEIDMTQAKKDIIWIEESLIEDWIKDGLIIKCGS